MITTATVRSVGQIDDTAAARIAELWNLAYPDLREALTTVINSRRDYLGKPEQVEQLSEEAKSSAAQYIKRMEETRRALGQLDRGTYRSCTRSPGAFSVSPALTAVSRALKALPVGSPHAGTAYRLAGELADAMAARNAKRMTVAA